MNEFLMWAGGIIATGVYGLIGWQINMIHAKFEKLANDHDQLESRLDAHRLYAAETFTTKKDVKDMKDEIVGHLIRIETKVDNSKQSH